MFTHRTGENHPMHTIPQTIYSFHVALWLLYHPLPGHHGVLLHDTARDWWEIAISKITTWSEFETVFLAAFLSEDY